MGLFEGLGHPDPGWRPGAPALPEPPPSQGPRLRLGFEEMGVE
jgi:hypothetical protein